MSASRPLVLLLLVAAACTTPRRTGGEAFGRSSKIDETPVDSLPSGARQVAEPEQIPALDGPAVEVAVLPADEEVAGLVAPSGRAVAVPVSVLARTPVVNLVLEGLPVSVVWDAASGAVAAYVTTSAGLGATGLVVDETFVVHERASAWAYGALTGARVGSEGPALVAYPFDVLPGAYWAALHPGTAVVQGASDVAAWERMRGGVTSSVNDGGLSAAAWVIGVVAGGVAAAIPVERLSGLRELEVGGEPLLVLPVPGGAMVRVRRVQGRVASFVPEGEHLVDRETGERWTIDGRCFEGASAGRVLARPSLERRVRWGAWRAAFPASALRE